MMSSPSPSASASRGLLLAVVLISVATLAVQVLQTRLFSVMLWHHLTYMVVTVTLLGFAAGGSLLAVVPALGRLGSDARVAVSVYSSLFGVTLIAAFTVLANSPLDTLDIEADRTKYFWLFLRYAYLVVPFLFAGLAIAVALSRFTAIVHRLYFWNLIGSGVGSVLFVLLVRPLGAPGCLFLFAALSGAAGLAALHGMSGGAVRSARVLAALTLAIWPASLVAPGLAATAIPIVPAKSKALALFEKFFDAIGSHFRAQDPNYRGVDDTLSTTLWTPLCRLDTRPVPPTLQQDAKDRAEPGTGPRSQVHVFQDGDAPTVIWSGAFARENAYDAHFYGLGYRLVRDPNVLIIGPGGGNDVETALHYGAKSVTAVDINGDTLALVRAKFGDYTNGVYERPGVRPVHSEGRSFLRREGGTYDLVQMSGTDTYAAMSSGSYIFSESYLYTEEAFDDFFHHLSDDGVVCVIRFNFVPPRETLKLVATAAGALKRIGVENPERCVLVVDQTDEQAPAVAAFIRSQSTDPKVQALAEDFARFFKDPLRYSFLMFRKRPFTAEQVAAIETSLAPMNSNPHVHHALAYAAGTRDEPANEYARFFAAMNGGDAALARFYDTYPNDVPRAEGVAPYTFQYDVRPARDDRPFFFNFHHWGDVWRGLTAESKADYAALTGSEPIGLYILAALFLQTTLVTLLLVVLPLLRLGFRSTAGGPSRTSVLAYFTALGVAYLLVEIVTIQRFVLYLGHPTYSLTAGLGSFLVFSGLGSATAGWLRAGRRFAAVAAVAVVAMLLVHAFVLPDFLRATLSDSEAMRVVWTIVWIAPLAFAMGMPFPTGLRQLGSASGLVPWAFGVNGAASVLASILAIVVAMEFGFGVVVFLAAGLYLMAAFCVPHAAPDVDAAGVETGVVDAPDVA
jgi:spermidine synthase